MSSGQRVVIVGGGVIGAASAYYLRQAGKEVAILDKGLFGKACSHGNCGYLSPSHVLPLCKPGAITKTLKSMFNNNSAFYLRPRVDLNLWSWLLKFARYCNEADMMSTGRALHALLQSSDSEYRRLFESELTKTEWDTSGMLFVYATQKMFDEYAETDALLRHEFGVGATPLNGKQLIELEPALKPGLAGAFKYDTDTHLRPSELMAAWKRRLLEMGVEIHENTEVTGFVTEDGQIKAARTANGEHTADQFVLAAGSWTPLLGKTLGYAPPIQPGKGYSITMPRPKICPRHSMILEEYHVAITPFQTGYRIGSTMEFAGYDETLNRQRLGLLRRGAGEYLLDPFAEPVEEEWYGWRPMSCDGKPIIDRVPRLSNTYVAAGHSMLGVSLATGTGKLLAELMTGTKPHVDPAPFRAARF